MFTGLIRERGRVTVASGGPEGVRLEVEAPRTAAGTGAGDSVSIDGACLTAEAVVDGRIAFHAVAETVRRSALGSLGPGAEVNIEPAVRAGEPLGGHYVQGHVDGVGRVRSHEPEGDGTRLWVEPPSDLLRYCVEKGAVTVDGVSLTIAALADDAFAAALVPHTLAVTTLGRLRPGDVVNLEIDVLAKYVERLVAR